LIAMAVRTYSAADLPIEKWKRLSNDSCLNSPWFVRVWETIGGTGRFIIDEINGEFAAGIAGVVFGKRFKRYESMPRSLPGGIFADDRYSPHELQQSYHRIAAELKKKKSVRTVINSPESYWQKAGFECKVRTTHYLDIPEELDSLPAKVREHIKSGMKRGATVSELDAEKDLEAFLKLAGSSYVRLKAENPYPDRFWEDLFRLSQDDSRVILLKATYEEVMIGARISFIEQDIIINWQMYSDEGSWEFKPGYLMTEKIIEIARERGTRKIDLGGTPEGKESLAKYKEQWGGTKSEIPYYVRYSIPGIVLLKWRGK